MDLVDVARRAFEWIGSVAVDVDGGLGWLEGDQRHVDAVRQEVNSAIISDTPFPYCYANFDGAVSNGASPEALAPADNAGDDANLTLTGTGSGYAALARAVFSSPDACSLLPPANPFPAAP